MGSHPLLEVRDMRAGYGKTQVLHGVSLTLHEGELVALIGRNGAGKTTCLKAITGELRPQGGLIRYRGEEITGEAPHDIAKRGIAHVKEGRRLFPRLTVRDNLLMGAYLRRDQAGIEEDLEEVLSIWPILRSRLSLRASLLSGGQQQMLAIAQALMLRPDMLILDEPSIGLAPLLVEEIFEHVDGLRDRGVSVLLVEQMVRQTLQICDRAYVLDTGKVVLEGNGADLLDDERVEATYLGTSSTSTSEP